jgi:glycosyltransferase involved in cell wall biosynthesis
VATEVGGVPFVIEDGVNGLLAPAGDPHAFAERLQWALDHRAGMHRMAEAGADQVRERFSSDRLVADIRRLYNELLS